jgi:hypothetical protein
VPLTEMFSAGAETQRECMAQEREVRFGQARSTIRADMETYIHNLFALGEDVFVWWASDHLQVPDMMCVAPIPRTGATRFAQSNGPSRRASVSKSCSQRKFSTLRGGKSLQPNHGRSVIDEPQVYVPPPLPRSTCHR